jgi:hypothetical protein
MKIADLLTSPRIIKHKNPRLPKFPPRNDPRSIHTSLQEVRIKISANNPKKGMKISVLSPSEESYMKK